MLDIRGFQAQSTLSFKAEEKPFDVRRSAFGVRCSRAGGAV